MIVIMASAAAYSALGTEVLAVQRLFYDITPESCGEYLPPFLQPVDWLRRWRTHAKYVRLTFVKWVL